MFYLYIYYQLCTPVYMQCCMSMCGERADRAYTGACNSVHVCECMRVEACVCVLFHVY